MLTESFLIIWLVILQALKIKSFNFYLQESKKPAKKRKRNQVIDENEEEEEPLSSFTNGSEKPAKDVGKKKSRSKRGAQ